MKKKMIPLILAGLAVLGTMVTIPMSAKEKTSVMIPADVSNRAHAYASRELVKELTNNNERVLSQFDKLIENLIVADESGRIESHIDIDRIIDAIDFAALKHRNQKRKGKHQTPYIVHPMGVANHLINIGRIYDPDVLIAAILHDTVEDTQTSLNEIDLRFGERVAGFVNEVSDDKSLPKEVRKQAQIDHAPDKSAEAAMIKLADKLYNLQDIGGENSPADWDKARVDNYFIWAKRVTDALPKVNAPLKQEVDRAIHNHFNG